MHMSHIDQYKLLALLLNKLPITFLFKGLSCILMKMHDIHFKQAQRVMVKYDARWGVDRRSGRIHTDPHGP